MYVAKHYRQSDSQQIYEFVKQHSFATLVSMYRNRPIASHIPIELDTSRASSPVLVGHVARANEIWRSFSQDEDVLAIFTGPHAYISPTWYSHVNVPTWNYQAVHIYGRPRILANEELQEALRGLIDKYEASSRNPGSIDDLPVEFLREQMRHIVGFEISVDKVEAAYKLSQNRDLVDFDNVIRELDERGDENSKGVAEAMRAKRAELFKGDDGDSRRPKS